tara:strand:+ start:231 stop:1145 length:915 start_codon:yes stop_codon:yes gene_type:complete
MRKLTYIFFFLLSFPLFSQDTLMPYILLDDVIISESNNGFSVEDFIGYVKNDTTFYMAFKHLRYYQHDYDGELNIYNKKNKKIGSLNKSGVHYVKDNKAWVVNNKIKHDGKIFKRNGKYHYYTAEAFDKIFFPKDTINVSLKIRKKYSQEDQNVRDAKTIGFSVGSNETQQSKGGLNKKLAIFDINMQQYYDYIISDTIYNNKLCYVFTVSVKKDLSQKDKKNALIRKIVSFFDKENFNVLYREYKFVYNHLVFDVDMNVIVNIDYVDDKHLPTSIYYNGYWNVLFFKPERANFNLKLSNYKVL